ncbi:MAG TPA: extracellular solute-binding protein [Epulopiscium sp.]|nr:extracellular solute-binding protein [Candidatus Epulonipiscium sp.]
MKKAITLILVAGLLTMSLSACSAKANNDKGNTTNIEENKENIEITAEETEEKMTMLELPESLENPDITILWHTSGQQYQINLAANPDTFDAVWSVKDEFEKKYGGKVNVIDVGWGDQKDTLIKQVNAGEVVDLVQAHDQNFPIYPAKNLVQDISKFVDLDNEFWNQGVTDAFKFGGNAYAAGIDATPVVIYYNKILFETYGQKTPMELFEEGNWTWETFRDTAIAMTGDTDGDSEVDAYGFGWWDTAYVQFLATNGVRSIAYNEDGTIGSNYLDASAIETMTFIQDAFLKDKFIDASQTGDYFIDLFKSGKLAMTCEYGFNGFDALSAGYEIGWAPLPKGPSGEELQGGGGLSGWSIPVTATNGEGAAAFMGMSASMQKEYSHSKLVNKYGEEDVALMNALAEKIVFFPIGIEAYWDANWTIYEGIINGTPVNTFLTTADEQIVAGGKATLEQ